MLPALLIVLTVLCGSLPDFEALLVVNSGTQEMAIMCPTMSCGLRGGVWVWREGITNKYEVLEWNLLHGVQLTVARSLFCRSALLRFPEVCVCVDDMSHAMVGGVARWVEVWNCKIYGWDGLQFNKKRFFARNPPNLSIQFSVKLH